MPAARTRKMPPAWKVTRYQPSIFHQERNWHKPLRTFASLLWTLFWVAVALWLLAGGVEARQMVGAVIRNFSQFFREAWSAFQGLLH